MYLFRLNLFIVVAALIKLSNTEYEISSSITKDKHQRNDMKEERRDVSSYNCTLNKLLEDFFSTQSIIKNTSYTEGNEKAKEFLSSRISVNVKNLNETSTKEKIIIDGIIASINMIKNNFTLEKNGVTDATKINETIVVENGTNNEYANEDTFKGEAIGNGIKKKESLIKNVIEEQYKTPNKTLTNVTSSNKIDNTTETLKPMTYIEVLTIEPNSTYTNIRPSSVHIVDILKYLMPNLKDGNQTIAVFENKINGTSFPAKNISTIIVTYSKENLTNASVTTGLSDETILKDENYNKTTDFDELNYDMAMEAPQISDVNYEEIIPQEANLTVLEQRNVLEAADYGIQMMHELYSIKEPKLYSMGLWLDNTNPARYVAAFNAPLEDSSKYFRYGYASLQAATKLQQLHSVDGLEARVEETPFPGVSALRNSALLEQCPLRGAPKCPPASKRYRTHDGTCNNFNRPRWGSTLTPVQRFLPPSYSDGLQAPRRSIFGAQLPSPREISALVHEDHDVETVTVTHLLMQWGQFVDHDITSSSQSRGFNGSVPRCCKDGGRDFVNREFMHPECMPISVPATDRFYGPRGIRCLEFIRSSPAPHDDCALGWREQLNQVSAYLDASPLYGSSARQSDKLRLFRNGMLQYGRVQQRRPLLPPERTRKDELCRGGAVSTDCFKSGDNRVNEHPGLVATHIIWLRQHNRMATELSHLNPHWSDEKIYQETRKIVGAMIQHITYKEFLPIVLGSEVMRLFDLEPQKKGHYKNYNPKVNPNPASSFGSAAFRFGHSLVQSSMMRYDRHHRPMDNNVSLHDEPTNPSNIWSIGAVDRLLFGMVNQPIQKRDEFITEELTNHLFQTPQFDFGMDLAAINIQRGRDHGIVPYTGWREPCGLTSIQDFEDLFRVMPSRAVRKLQELYRHVDDIDLFTGGMSERPVIGGLVGPTFACIIAQQFSNLRKGDRFWYENGAFDSSFTPAQLQQIRRITLAQVLCKTLDSIDSIQPFVFLSADQQLNRRTSCSNGLLNNFDLSPWIEVDSTFNNNIDFDKTEKITKKPVSKINTKLPLTESKPVTSGSKNVTQKIPAPLAMTNSTKSQNSTTGRIRPTTDHDRIDNTDNNTPNNNVTLQKIDDKLDFRNKSKRYDHPNEDTGAYDRNRPQSNKQHYYNNDHEDYDEDKYTDDNIYQQSVLINNNRNKRPNKHNRPVIAVTENIDKFTYLINYVPKTTPRSWKHTTRPNSDKDVVKVTYQTYEDTYRRPQPIYVNNQQAIPTYFNNRLVQKPIDDYDEYRRQRPDYHTTRYFDHFQSSARANDVNTLYTKETSASSQRVSTKDEISTTTETYYKLVTFSHLGTYNKMNGFDTDKIKNNTERKIDKDDIIRPYINSKSDLITNKNKENTDIIYSKDFSLTKDSKDKLYDQYEIQTDKFTTANPPRLSTFFLNHESTKSSLISRLTTRHETKTDDGLSTTDHSHNAPGRYFYAGNILKRYPEIDSASTTTEQHIDKDMLLENYINPGRHDDVKITYDIKERSSMDTLILDDELSIDTSAEMEKGGKVRIVKPSDLHKSPSVAFQVTPSENSPTTWAMYEERSELHEAIAQAMPTVNSDPHALKELPRPMNLSSNVKLKRRKP